MNRGTIKVAVVLSLGKIVGSASQSCATPVGWGGLCGPNYGKWWWRLRPARHWRGRCQKPFL